MVSAARVLVNRNMAIHEIQLTTLGAGPRLIEADSTGAKRFHFASGQNDASFERILNAIIVSSPPILRDELSLGSFAGHCLSLEVRRTPSPRELTIGWSQQLEPMAISYLARTYPKGLQRI